MKKSLLALLALAILAIPSVCLALPPHVGPYVSGFLGVTIPNNTDSTSMLLNDRVEFNPGVNIGGTGGYNFGFLRLEGEVSYKQGNLSKVHDRVSGVTYTGINDNGYLGVFGMMGNVFVDIHNQSPITPYFGGGIGFASIHQYDTFGTASNSGAYTPLYRDDDDTVFAYQAGAGVEMALTRMFSLDLGYRYFATDKAHFNAGSAFENDLKFESHNVTVGLRVKF